VTSDERRAEVLGELSAEGSSMASRIMGEIIAERVLNLVHENGNTTQVFVRMGKPQASPKGDDFHCTCQIAGIGDEKIHEIFGIDAFQALQLTLRDIAFQLHYYRKESNQVLYAWDRGDDMGFPLRPGDELSDPPVV
jgi:hypothetical protein